MAASQGVARRAAARCRGIGGGAKAAADAAQSNVIASEVRAIAFATSKSSTKFVYNFNLKAESRRRDLRRARDARERRAAAGRGKAEDSPECSAQEDFRSGGAP
jgi:hypothetical protein